MGGVIGESSDILRRARHDACTKGAGGSGRRAPTPCANPGRNSPGADKAPIARWAFPAYTPSWDGEQSELNTSVTALSAGDGRYSPCEGVEETRSPSIVSDGDTWDRYELL
jgi:hypothetical protein